MKRITALSSFFLFTLSASFSQGYNVGDKASDFKLKNVDGKFVSLSDYQDAKGFIVIFTCNHCPYAKAYQDRIIGLDKKYKSLGYPVIAINPNDPELAPEDSFEKMASLSKEREYPFPYLFDEKQEVYRKYGASRTPHVYILQKKGIELMVEYIGAIDDNYQDEAKVTQPYLANAVDALLTGKTPEPSLTKAIGCSIKDKKIK